MTWSDGKPFTADDVVYTLEMLIANGKGKKDLVQSAGVADAVKGVDQDRPADRQDRSRRSPIRASRFNYLINYFDIGLQWLPAHVWKDVEDPGSFRFFDLAKGWPVTTGPWKVTRFTDNQIFMDRRSEWWAAKAGLAPMPAMERVITIPGGTRDRMAQLITANQVDIVNDIQISDVVKQIITQNPKITTFTGQNAALRREGLVADLALFQPQERQVGRREPAPRHQPLHRPQAAHRHRLLRARASRSTTRSPASARSSPTSTRCARSPTSTASAPSTRRRATS